MALASVEIDRESGTFNIFITYYIPAYVDPETGEEFAETSWTATTSLGGAWSGWGWESGDAWLELFLDQDIGLQHYSIDFSAQNNFSGQTDQISLDIYEDAFATEAHAIDGSAARDIVLTGSGADTLRGMDGNDLLDAGDGNDSLEGGSGSDTLNGGGGVDTLAGGADGDIYYANDVGDVIVEEAGGGTDTVYATTDHRLAANVENLWIYSTFDVAGIGNAGDNELIGSIGNNLLKGLGGRDNIYGAEGDDTLVGGDGRDTLNGGAGANTMHGGAGNDIYYVWSALDTTIEGTNGGQRDLVRTVNLGAYTLGANVEDLETVSAIAFRGTGNGSDNRITGNILADRLTGLDGNDRLDGGAGNDTLVGGAGSDRLDGGAGKDLANYAGAGPVTIDLAAGTASEGDTLNDVEDIRGSSGNDSITGDAANNMLIGDSGADTLTGGAGADLVVGGADGDVLDGGDGIDTLSYSAAFVGITVNLAAGTASGGEADGDSFTGFENVIGGHAADTLTGNDLANKLNGGDGSDTLDGGLGNDLLIGGAGADTLAGGLGNDTISYAGSAQRVVIDLGPQTASGGDAEGDIFSGIESAIGGSGNDALRGNQAANMLGGGSGNDRIWGNAGDDTVNGGAGADTMDGGAGIDTLSYAGSHSGVYINLASDHAGYGAAGDVFSGFENLMGSEMGDVLYGDDTGNRVSGRAGFDFIDGRAGNDTLTGGADSDTFAFGLGYGRDIVTDFAIKSDLLFISLGEDFDTFGEIMAVASSVNGNTVFTFDASAVLILQGVDMAALTYENFYFG
jgi:Ca2+-binding RTX toxin-like protein